MKVLCIYHGNCADGFTAAWAVHKALGERVEFHAGIYGQPAPDVTGRHVLLVDFSYKRPVLLDMAKVGRSIVILDHHKTAAEDLAGFRQPAPYETWRDKILSPVEGDAEPIAALFDMERSGAQIAWDFLHPGVPRPRLVDYVGDRDLWRFKLPHSREVAATIFSYEYTFENWNRLAWLMQDSQGVKTAADQGEAIERKHHKDIAELLAVTKRTMIIGGYAVPVANLPYTMSSDAGNLMAKGERFAGCYWDTPTARIFSLRSTDEGLDVSAIAKSYGGGGHRNASGFQMPVGWEGDVPAIAAA